ncbi:Leucine-rich repeat transmembrane neuronal protein 2 [Holothuria leucospilota]|uniref:Leucine-rich repeat transmembrane neuronal protein 2 n=1 Tax=Holothuria leucospilota TaxID=206669 RepID=A0A9Q1BJ60_HOLLE|nr:Leucine-rich repeat transmembrane neuronal protein 2 [Holothuria leucospilota]
MWLKQVPLYSHFGGGSICFLQFICAFIVVFGSHGTFGTPTVSPVAATTENVSPTCGQACEYEDLYRRAHCDQRRLAFVPISTGCAGVTLFEIQENNITSITTEQLSGYTLVRTLDISRNQISSFRPGTFINNRQMTNIIASYNKLQILLRCTFNGTERSMQRIYLDNNSIQFIENETFFGLDKLQVLYLQNNRLHEVPGGLFAGLIALNHVNLSNNQLHDIPPPFQLGFCYLEKLDLRNNQLYQCASIVPFFYNITNGFHFSGNPLICDCDFLTIQKWFYETNHPQNSQIGCKLDNETYFDVKDNLTIPCEETGTDTSPQDPIVTTFQSLTKVTSSANTWNKEVTTRSPQSKGTHISISPKYDDENEKQIEISVDDMKVSRYGYRVPWISYYTGALLTIYIVFHFVKWATKFCGKQTYKKIKLSKRSSHLNTTSPV